MAAFDPEKPEFLILDALNRIGIHPKHRFIIDKMTVDFAFPELKLAVELEGKHRHEAIRNPAERDAYLKQQGWRVYWVSTDRAFEAPNLVANSIAGFIRQTAPAKPAVVQKLAEKVQTHPIIRKVHRKVQEHAKKLQVKRTPVKHQPAPVKHQEHKKITRGKKTERDIIKDFLLALVGLMIMSFILMALSNY